MTQRELERLPHDVRVSLSRLEWHIRGMVAMRRMGHWLTGLGVIVAVSLVLDYFWDLPVSLRAGLLIAFAGLLAAALLIGLLWPLLQRRTAAELAAVVEAAHPELAERLTSTIELSDPETPDEYKGSALMRRLLERETARSIAQIPVEDSVDSRPALRWATTGALTLIFLLAPFGLAGSTYSLLWARFLSPWGNYERPSNLYFEVEDGDRVVARGSDVRLLATPAWRTGSGELPESVWLSMSRSDGERDLRRMDFDPARQAYAATVPHVMQSFKYDISTDGSRTRRFAVRAVDAPQVDLLQLDVSPPPYTGRPSQFFDGGIATIDVFEQSRLHLRMEFSKPVARAELVVEGIVPAAASSRRSDRRSDRGIAPGAAAEIPHSELPEGTVIPIELVVDARTGSVQLTAATSGEFAVRLFDEHGVRSLAEPVHSVTVTPDTAPVIEVLAPQQPEIEARPDDVISVAVRASDDIGVHELELRYEILGRARDEHTITVAAARLDRRQVAHEFTLDLAEIGVRDGNTVSYRIRAADERAVPGPNVTWSNQQFIRIEAEAAAPESAEIRQRQQMWRAALERLVKQLKAAQRDAAQLGEAVDQSVQKQEPFGNDADITQLADEATQADQVLDTLRELLGAHPLYASLEPELAGVSTEQLQPAAKDAMLAAEAELKEKREPLREVEGRFDQAAERLAKLIEQLDERAELEQELLTLNRLATQAEKLAEHVGNFEQQRQELDAMPAGEQRDALAEQLQKRQQELLAQQQQLSSELNDLLAQRPDLLEAAKNAELDRLRKFAEQAAQIAESQDKLAEALSGQASATADEAAPLANAQQQALDQSNQVTLPRPDERMQNVPAIDPQLLADALQALKNGDLAEAAEAQRQASEELERLAREIEKYGDLPADPREAVKRLARSQNQLAADIRKTEQAANKPDASAEDVDRKRRELATRQAGLQAAVANLEFPQRLTDRQREAAQQAANVVRHLVEDRDRPAADEASRVKQALDRMAGEIGSVNDRRRRAQEELKRLQQEQRGISDQTRQLAKQQRDNADADLQKPLNQLAERQESLARQLADLDVPGAEQEHQAAVESAARAIADLQQHLAQDAPASQQAVAQAMHELDRKLQRKPTAAAEFNKIEPEFQRARESAEQAIDQADANKLRTAAQQLDRVKERLKKLPGEIAQKEKQQAEQALNTAKQKLEQAAGNADRISEAADKLAESQQAMQRLRQAVQPPSEQSPAEQARTLANHQQKMAEAAQELSEETQYAASEPAILRAEASLNRQWADQLQSLPAGPSLQEKKQAALSQLQAAADAAEQAKRSAQQDAARMAKEQENAGADQPAEHDAPRSEQAQDALAANAAAQQAAANALDELAEQLARPSALADATERQKKAVADASQLAEDVSPAAHQEEQTLTPEKARELAARQAELAQQSEAVAEQTAGGENPQMAVSSAAQAQAGNPELAENSPPAEPPAEPGAQSAQPASSNETPSDEQAMAAEGSPTETGPPAGNSTPAPAPEALAEQQRLAQEAAELALEVATETGPGSPAAQQAVEFAQHAQAAGEQAETGQPQAAVPSARQAEQAARSASEQLAGDNPDAPLQQRMQNLAERQQSVAEQFEQVAASETGSAQAQQAGQRSLAGRTAQLGQQIEQAAERLASAPIGAASEGEQARQAAGQTAQAEGTMNRALQQAQSGDASQAAASSAQAAEQLRQVAGQLGQTPAGSETAVPNEVGEQVAGASQQLQQAREQLQQAGQPNPGSPSEGTQQAAGQSGPQQSQGSSNPGQPAPPGEQLASGESQATGQPPGPAAQAMQQVAESLQQAAQGLQPAGGPPSSSAGSLGGQQAGGARATFQPGSIDSRLEGMTQREWGELPGVLKNEIRQARRRQPSGEYAPLIRNYFKEIARRRRPQLNDPAR